MTSEIRGHPCKPHRWADFFGILATIAIVLIAWRAVVFEGRTFDGSSLVWGVNGGAPPTGVQRPTVIDHVRVDLGASAWATMPWAEVTNREWSQDVVPLWNPYQAAGSPHAANMQSSVFDPLLLAVNLHPTPLTWDWTILFCFVLGSCGTYLFSRNLGLGAEAAFTGAAAYSLSGFFVINNNNSFVRTYSYIPILLFAVDMVVKSTKLRWVALLGGLIAATILAGMPEAAFFSLALAALYALYRMVVSVPRSRLQLLARMGSSGLLGLMLAAPLLTLFLQYLPLSFNVHASGAGLGSASPTTLLNWFAPLVNGYPNALYAGLSGDRSWSGTAVFALALVALSSAPMLRRRDAWLFFGIAVVVLLKMHGYPGVQWLGQLPISDRAIWPAFAPPVAGFCLAVAAAIGVQNILQGNVRRLRLVLFCGLLALLLGILYVIDWPSLHPAAAAGAVRQSILTAFGAGAIVGICALSAASTLRVRRIAVVVVAVTVIGELLLFVPDDNFAKRAEPYRAPGWMRLLADRKPADRVFGFDSILYPDTAGALGIQDIRTLDALYINRYLTYVRFFVTPTFVDRFTGEGMSPVEITANRMFDLLGVRYILAGSARLSLTDGATSQFSRVGEQDGVTVYRNSQAIPRAFIASEVHRVESMNTAILYLQSLGHRLANGTTRVDRFDPEREAVVEAQNLPQPLQNPSLSNGGSRPASIVSYAPDRIELDVPEGSPGLLVLTDTFYPGWVATVNGRAAPILPTDVAFRGVALGPEAATVVFRYRPKTAVLGWAIAIVAVLAFLVIARMLHTRRRILPST